MTLFRKRVSEQQVTETFIKQMFDNITSYQNSVDYFAKECGKLIKSPIEFRDDRVAIMDLAYAVVACELQVLKNLYKSDEVQKMNTHIQQIISTKNYANLAQEQLAQYEKIYTDAIVQHQDPISSVASTLLHKWILNIDGYEKSSVLVNIVNGNKPDLDILTLASIVLSGPVTYWKTVKDKFKIV